MSIQKIHLILPMGGKGTRFIDKGFDFPKPLIDLRGKPFFFWATQSIIKFMDVENITFVVLKEHIDKFFIDKRILEFYPEAHIHVIPHVLNGAVLTCREGVRDISDDLPILFNDCDHAFICDSFYEYCRKGDFTDLDGGLLTFNSDSPNYSYVKFDENGNIVGTVEKQVVSNEAICGAYFFKNKKVFEEATEEYLDKCAYNEFFMSGLYNEIITRGGKICTFSVGEHITFGTPDEYELAKHDSRIGVWI